MHFPTKSAPLSCAEVVLHITEDKESIMARITKRNGLNKTTNAYVPKSNKYAVAQATAKLDAIYNGTADLNDLLSVKEEKIDFMSCERKIKTIQLIYNAGSQVGACTVVAGNMFTVKLTDKTSEAFKKSLKMLKRRAEHIPYGKSIWVEGTNKFTAYAFKTGHMYVYYVVTNAEMEELKRRISNMDYDSVTLEELNQLQMDLPPFVRAWQESSIDCSKDKDKVFNYTFADFFKKVEVVSTYLKANADGIKINLDTLKQLHRAGRTKDIRFAVTLPLDTAEEVYEDILGGVNLEIAGAVENYFNSDMLELYKMSNRNYYKQFADACLEYPELAWYIQQVYTMVAQSYNEDTRITPEQYEELRDAIYSKAKDCGMTDMTNVVKVAISVAMRYVKETEDKEGNKYIDLGTANVDNYKPSKVTNIFPAEYVALRSGVRETKELTLLYVDKDTRIEEGQTVEFVSGFSVDDTVEVEELFTGVAYNKGGKLVYDVDPYSYNYMTTIITVDTFAADATTADKKTDSGEFMSEYLETYDSVILTGKNRNVLVAGDRKTLVAKVVPAPALIPADKKAMIYNIVDVMSFEPNAGRGRVFFIVLSK